MKGHVHDNTRKQGRDMIAAVWALVFLGFPLLMVLATTRLPLAEKLGPIVLCYMGGLLLGLSGLIPEGAASLRGDLIDISLALALPLLLFSVDLRAWGRLASRALLSLVFAVASVVGVAVALFHIFTARGTEQTEQLSGMAVGMYTGGIANLGAIKLALDIPEERYLVFATADTVVGAFYLLFVLTLAKGVFSRFLPAFEGDMIAAEGPEDHAPVKLDRNFAVNGAIAVLAAGFCVGLSLALAPHLRFAEETIVIIVLLTTIGLAASLVPPLRRNKAATPVGMYLIYVFSFCVAASMDLASLAGADSSILAFVALATLGTLSLHALLCRLARIDADTFIITSVAAIMSPAFVPMVARSLRNPAVLMSGMATGILGFAIGNYLGISVALFLRAGG